MKRISVFLALALFSSALGLRAQDAAVEERLKRLDGKIQDLIDAKEAQDRRIDELSKLVRNLVEQANNKPAATYAGHEDVKQLAAKLQEVDQKRQQDYEVVRKELKEVLAALKAPARSAAATRPAAAPGASAPSGDVYEYTIQAGDTLNAIALAYRKENVKITTDQILQANPGLDPLKLKPGQTIYIPAPPR